MEKSKVTTREKLKTYFETGKYPTQSQFSELIDSLKHKDDIPSNREVVILANSLASLDNGYIQYLVNDIEDLKFPIVIIQQDAEDQVIEISNTHGYQEKQYFLGSAPYLLKAKEFPTRKLRKYEYYRMYYQLNNNDGTSTVYRIFGNNLPTIPDGFEFGAVDSNGFYIQLYKQSFGQQIDILNTSIKFINKTKAFIEYKAATGGNYWSDRFRNGDTITNHYSLSDSLSFSYNADLREIDEPIECKVYDADKGTLLMTGYLYAGEYNKNVWGGGQTLKNRNVRIECNYQKP